MVASLINQKSTMVEGIRYAQEMIDGSMTMLILTPKALFAARDRLGRTPLIIGKKDGARCFSFESHAYINLGYEDEKSLKKAVKDGETEAGFILKGAGDVTYVVNDMEMSDRKSDTFREALFEEIKEQKLLEAGISKEEIESMENMQISVTSEILG